ncbi:hypothetical protein OKA05_03040 [Luteolibacter arcticus]|uniref:Lipoprotein n=1 Tax=Luteolibacter arcticus TaxID=1581411 RepID=A0ABT3GD06_9BACT|nr:hypothetical protein [Luteolibacter arcticus]MCW1921512.1 hypothetical protein [Luteolibacter arcticus]
MKLPILPFLLVLASCAGPGSYRPVTSDTAWVYEDRAANPIVWVSGKKLRLSIETIDGKPKGTHEVDAGRHTFGLVGEGLERMQVRGSLTVRIEKDTYYYFSCVKVEQGRYRFVCEVDFDDGDEETDAKREITSVTVSVKE